MRDGDRVSFGLLFGRFTYFMCGMDLYQDLIEYGLDVKLDLLHLY